MIDEPSLQISASSGYNTSMTIDIKFLGPLAHLAGKWQGSVGDDTAPDDDRGIEKNAFREQIIFTPTGVTMNHEQTLYGLMYERIAWRLREEQPFHHQLGYWIWDPGAKQVMHSFMIPRGMTVLAGGTAEADSSVVSVSAVLGSTTFGICSNPFLDREFKTIRYDAKLTFHSPHSLSYEEDTQIQIQGQQNVFHHVDKNSLEKTKDS
jgi:hypothetical protein